MLGCLHQYYSGLIGPGSDVSAGQIFQENSLKGDPGLTDEKIQRHFLILMG